MKDTFYMEFKIIKEEPAEVSPLKLKVFDYN
jgi:hypothetical protein